VKTLVHLTIFQPIGDFVGVATPLAAWGISGNAPVTSLLPQPHLLSPDIHGAEAAEFAESGKKAVSNKQGDRGGSAGKRRRGRSTTEMQEQFYTVAEAAEILKVSTDKVTRMFEDEPGVVDLGSPEHSHKRGYRVLRIPLAVFNRVIHKRRVQ